MYLYYKLTVVYQAKGLNTGCLCTKIDCSFNIQIFKILVLSFLCFSFSNFNFISVHFYCDNIIFF